jgi:hypothetical protein
MKRWVFFVLVVGLLVVQNGHTYATLEKRTRALERAMELGENQLATIGRQTGVIERQTEALNECSTALDRVSKSVNKISRR